MDGIGDAVSMDASHAIYDGFGMVGGRIGGGMDGVMQ